MPPIAGLAGHLADGFDALGQEQRSRAEARRGKRGFGAGMAAADHDHVEMLGMVNHGA